MSLGGPKQRGIEWPTTPDIEKSMGDLTGMTARWHGWDTDGDEAWAEYPAGPGGDPHYLPSPLTIGVVDPTLGWAYAVAASIEVFWSSDTVDSGVFSMGMASLQRFGDVCRLNLNSNNNVCSKVGLWGLDEWFKLTYISIGGGSLTACIDDVEELSMRSWGYGGDLVNEWIITAGIGAIETPSEAGVHVRNFKGAMARLDPPWSQR